MSAHPTPSGQPSACAPISSEKALNLFEALGFSFQHEKHVRALLDPALGLLERDQQGKRSWENVPAHCLTAATAGAALFDALGLADEEKARLTRFLILHDASKREEVEFARSCPERREAARGVLSQPLQELDPDSQLLAATGPGYLALREGASLTQRLIHWIDNACMGDGLTYPAERIAEVRSRRTDLTAKHGEQMWLDEIAASQKDAEVICELLAERKIIVAPERLASFLIERHLARAGVINSGTFRELPAAEPGSELLSSHYHLQMISAPGYSNKPNEDSYYIKVQGRKARLGVFDGATAIGGFIAKEQPGAMAARIAKEALAAASPAATPFECLSQCNRALQNALTGLFLGQDLEKSLFSAMAIIADVERMPKGFLRVTYAGLGDCRIGIIDHQGKITWHTRGERVESFEALEIEEAHYEVKRKRGSSLADVLNDRSAYPLTHAVLNKHRQLENDPLGKGYGTLKGGAWEDTARYIESGQLIFASGEVRGVLLISDGALPPVTVPNSKRTEFAEAAIREGGIRELHERRRRWARLNRACTTPPCLKAMDDITMLHLRNR